MRRPGHRRHHRGQPARGAGLSVRRACPAAAWTAARFIADAVSRGAVAVLAPEGTAWPPGVPPRPLLEDPEPRRRLAQLAAGWPGGQPRVVVAVTGTNGKTSTVEFLRQIWARGGRPAASLGTLGLIAPGFDPGPGLTTPDPVSLAETLARLARAGIQHAAMEASSHGLDQFRLDGVRLAAGGIHQPDARPSGLPRLAGRLPAGQAAAVRRIAARGRAGRGEQRHGCGDAAALWPRSPRGGGSTCAPSARPARRSGCWPCSRGPTVRCCASTRRASGARSCCRCRVASRRTTR